jgi:type III restriction enzyme
MVFHEGNDIKYIYFVAETNGYDKDGQKDYHRAESVKKECASRHFAAISDSHVTYDVVKNYAELWNIITKP